jgi:diguanylate cyclase (GGDEF)-like protein
MHLCSRAFARDVRLHRPPSGARRTAKSSASHSTQRHCWTSKARWSAIKAVNDAAGHAAGDAALRKVAEACRLAVRSSDIVGRLGGDEFAIILENCPEDRAADIGQKLLRALNPMEFEWQGSRYTIGASIGLAMNRDMADEKSWLEAADKACYIAKRDGRGLLRIAALVQSDELHTKQG